MSSIINDSIGGFNTFLKQQKELKDEATLTVALFDDKYELLYDNVDVKKAEELTNKIWYPRGTTALYDAIGKTINAVKATHTKLGNERPAKVLVCIVTDGMENASHEYKLENIKSLIKQCEADEWNFIYLAANQDAFSISNSFGISKGNTLNFVATSAGVNSLYDAFYSTTTSYRGMSSSSADFKSRSKSLIDDKNNPTNVDPNFLVKDANGNTSVTGDDLNNLGLPRNGYNITTGTLNVSNGVNSNNLNDYSLISNETLGNVGEPYTLSADTFTTSINKNITTKDFLNTLKEPLKVKFENKNTVTSK